MIIHFDFSDATSTQLKTAHSGLLGMLRAKRIRMDGQSRQVLNAALLTVEAELSMNKSGSALPLANMNEIQLDYTAKNALWLANMLNSHHYDETLEASLRDVAAECQDELDRRYAAGDDEETQPTRTIR